MSLQEDDRTWSYESAGSVGVWHIHDVEGLFEADVAEAQQHFRETAGRPDVTGAVVAFEDDTSLGREMQEHMADAWSELGRAVDLDRTAYVADGVRAMAVKANVDIPDTELRAFDDVDAAVDWARA